MNYKRPLAFVLVAFVLGMTAMAAQSQQDPTTPPGRLDAPRPDEPPAQPNAPVQNPIAPPTLDLPVGTLVTVRTTQLLSSDRNRPGDRFTTLLDQPVVAQGWVLARRGQTVLGTIATVKKADRNQDNSQLAVVLDELMLVDGQQVPIKTELVQISGGNSSAQSLEKAATVGTTTGIGAVIGAAAGRGEGAAIGAIVGATAGIAGVLSTRGRPTEIYPETVLTFRLDAPLTISTERSQQAFLPVTPDDYSRRPARYRTGSYPPDGYPPPGGYPPPVYYAPYGWYPYGYYGYYGYYGPWYYPGFGVYIRPGRRGWF